ncbi:hypothetical protein MA16_Dca026565 [Dendrobium catenatum]|uniref:Uncharacterized protein n=1 Tax=Dendrobium catenatum TaxID=906689 RepID=A0A2I0VE15_9ASPA|nr:hypothetical protein MA16_Dca026565 [Dendrobium catenatum]
MTKSGMPEGDGVELGAESLNGVAVRSVQRVDSILIMSTEKDFVVPEILNDKAIGIKMRLNIDCQ